MQAARSNEDIRAGDAVGLSPDPQPVVDELDLLRARHYDLLAALLGRPPTEQLLRALAGAKGDGSPLGRAHAVLGRAAMDTSAAVVERQFFDLFIGVGRGELLPYGSYYLTGFLNERPLMRVRQDLAVLGIERSGDMREPEDHIAILLDVMAGLASARIQAEPGAQRRFFERHIESWAVRFFSDLEVAPSSSGFYSAVGALGRLFVEIEAEAFAMES